VKARFEFWYDVVCPYAYLASTQVARLEAEHEAVAVYRPFLLGGLFRELGRPTDLNEGMPEAKAKMNRLDMRRWARHFGVPLTMPASHPQRTVLALRALLAAGDENRVAVTDALFRAYWVEGRAITKPEVVAEVLDDAGVDGHACVQAATTQPIKDRLRSETDVAVARGIFGAPAFVVNGELHWGQDRLDFVSEALSAA